MIQIEREKLDKVLEALERSVATCFNQYAHQQVMSQPDHFINTAITAIKEALAQMQEPVRIMGFDCVCGRRMTVSAEQGVVPAPQRTWVGLTAGEILDTLISVDEKTVRLPAMLGQFACAIEAKLKEKNA